jgi:uncharacterized integral membrane protein
VATTKPTTSRKRAPNWTTKTWVRIIVGILIVVYVILFIVLNSQSVKIDFVFFNVRSRLWVGFLVCVVLGGVLGIALAAYRGRNAKKTDKPPAA